MVPSNGECTDIYSYAGYRSRACMNRWQAQARTDGNPFCHQGADGSGETDHPPLSSVKKKQRLKFIRKYPEHEQVVNHSLKFEKLQGDADFFERDRGR